MILISNIYYMLAYAFHLLSAGDIDNLGCEEFEHLHELFAEIIIHSMRRQIKRGLPKGYQEYREELGNLRGKIDFQTSIRQSTLVRHRLMCEFDEFTEDTLGNRLIKNAIACLLQQDNVDSERKHYLKLLHTTLSGVKDTQYRKIPPQRTGGAEYIMLVNVCRFLLDGLLMNVDGIHKMREWLPDEQMSTLYEHFLLEYFKKHHPCLNARAARIDWDTNELPSEMPAMRSDVFLTYSGRTMIIDAKFYSHTMTEYYGKRTYHSHNLYQIFTYVKNADTAKDGSVAGMLLYAKTDEDLTPDSKCIIGGNAIVIKTLDLSQPFYIIKSQLEAIVQALKHMNSVVAV